MENEDHDKPQKTSHAVNFIEMKKLKKKREIIV